MHDEDRINPGHQTARNVLRIVGPLTFAVGGIFMLVGLVSFFSAFAPGGGFPRLFWCCFVGMPLMFVGMVMSNFGFMGTITRYQAGEIAPVGKDAFNYMADGTKDGVRTIATAIASGLQQASSKGTLTCSACGHSNDDLARFCDQCGAVLSKDCPSCGERNDGDAKFCDGCGNRLETKAE